MKVNIDIRKTSVMGIVEGMTVILSQHNGGSPSFDQLWAAPSEQAKLDISYREAVNDLETKLTKWLSKSSSQFDLQHDGDDYRLSLILSNRWNSRLYGLLCNKLQDYLVHYILNGWLTTFDGVQFPDYLSQAQQDATDIERILLEQDLSFDAFARGSGNDSAKDVSEGGTPTSERQSANDATKDLSGGSTATSERQSAYDSAKGGGSDAPVAGERNTDNSRVLIHHERMNMSGRLTPRDMCMRPPKKVMEPYDDTNLRRWIIDLQNSVNTLRSIIEDGVVIDEHYVHTDNNYTNEEKSKLRGLHNYDDSALRALIGGKQDKTSVVPVVFDAAGSVATEEDMIAILSPNTIVEATFVDYMAFVFDSPYNNEKSEYCLKFDVGNSVPSLDLGEEISWAEALTLEANKHYVIVVTYECGALYGDWKSYPIIEQEEEEEEE